MTFRRQTGFSLLETMVALTVLMIVGGIVMTGLVQMMKTQGTLANRTEMHTSVRSATELMEQEIGQAGRITLGGSQTTGGITLASAVAGSTGSTGTNFTLSYPSGTPVPNIFQGEVLTVDAANGTGASVQEAVTLTAGDSTGAGTAVFTNSHPAGVPVMVLGAFATGVVPPAAGALTDPLGQCVPTSVTVGGVAQTYVGYTNGSTCETLKLYGDVNSDGNIVYVQYDCVQGTPAAPGVLYRQQLKFGDTKPPNPPNSAILLANVLKNPLDVNGNKVPCFRYQVQPLGTGWVVTDVAVTLTVQTQNIDPTTHVAQTETKALLNVSPRNVFEVLVTANQVDPTRAQSMPPWIASLLP